MSIPKINLTSLRYQTTQISMSSCRYPQFSPDSKLRPPRKPPLRLLLGLKVNQKYFWILVVLEDVERRRRGHVQWCLWLWWHRIRCLTWSRICRVGHGDLGMFGYREKVRSVWLLSVDTLDC